ncbi:DUF2158 domain-containing protein [Sphingomonas sp. RP10(2022)]|uniref:DUF2158 domain-containing protein n=1 Tax=Sphingomonas liriopis TaxID=2949094 RepID=A0A9X2KQ56_9SPHN|nr:DUF2158 domain-containing protein [Sphingomonas liriopis]MCP3734607.1 DUF2158 domain-containing protein [Sphingomonas liriopis]
MEFSPGDVVVLKSGSDPMTVETVDENGVWCVWANGKKIESQGFNPVVLEKYSVSFG